MNITTSGATAVSVLLINEQGNLDIGSSSIDASSRKLFVANVGDSRAVLVSSKRIDHSPLSFEDNDQSSTIPPSGYFATRLTYDHRAEDIAEQNRIKEAGGFITRNRVLGILAVSRSFGDHGMKDFVTGVFFVLLQSLVFRVMRGNTFC